MANPIDAFFNLGNKVTHGDMVLKAKFDYYLYWIIFLAFLSIAFQYYYNFFFGTGQFSTLMWAVIITGICWFNYNALGQFRMVYNSMKDMQRKMKNIEVSKEEVENMEKEFKHGKRK